MIRSVTLRVLQALLSLLGIIVLVFFLGRLTGDPAREYLPEAATQAQVHEFDVLHGYTRPLYDQFFSFLGNVTHLNFGTSLEFSQSAIHLVLNRYPSTLRLAFFVVLVSCLVGVTIGVLAARKPRSVFSELARVLSLIAVSVPAFWVGIIGIVVFSVTLHLLPTSGSGSAQYYVLPVLTLALQPTGILVQVTRSSVEEVLKSDYVKIAKAKGVPEWSILFRHALRNAASPVLTVAGTLAAAVLNGALVVETVFGWPGVGNLMVEAIQGRDFAVVEGVIFVTALAIIVLNFVIDVAYMWLNPQLR